MGIEQLKNARIEGNKLFFDGDLIEEGSWGQRDIGHFKNVMELNMDDSGDGCIIWNYGKKAPDEDEVVIGLWFNNLELVDYDGVMSFPLPALVLLEHLGYNCDYVKDE